MHNIKRKIRILVAKLFGFPITYVNGSLRDKECETLLQTAKNQYCIFISETKRFSNEEQSFVSNNLYDWFHVEQKFDHYETLVYNRMLNFAMYGECSNRNYILPEKADGFMWHASAKQRCLAYIMMKEYNKKTSVALTNSRN